MMEREVHVYVDVDGEPVQAGKLWSYLKVGRQSALFVYESDWLSRRGSFALAPSLMLSHGRFYSDGDVHGPFSDTAPDSWGRDLMRYDEQNKAKEEGVSPKTLYGIDFLTGVSDEVRLGAIRFKNPGASNFLAFGKRSVPRLINLKELLAAAERIDQGRPRASDLAIVLDPGSALGGARPKAIVRDTNGDLLLAKFTSRKDSWPVILWEATVLSLAVKAKINVAPWRLHKVANKDILLMRRFDRTQDHLRIPYISAMTALDASDHSDDRSYLELVDFLRQHGGSVEANLKQLWRRMVFNVLVSNTDDHLRNHGFLYSKGGWRLSPAFDMNPCPTDVRARIHQLCLNETDKTASVEILLSVADYFGVTKVEASKIMGEVGIAVSKWIEKAKAKGLSRDQIARMESAFKHDDLTAAVKLAKVGARAPARRKAPTPKQPTAKRTEKRPTQQDTVKPHPKNRSTTRKRSATPTA